MEDKIVSYNAKDQWIAINAIDLKYDENPIPKEVVVQPEPSEWNPDYLEMPRDGILNMYFKELMNDKTIIIKNRTNDYLNNLIPNNADLKDFNLTFKFEKFEDPNEPDNVGANISNLLSSQTIYDTTNIKFEDIENVASINGLFNSTKFIDCPEKVTEYLEYFKDLGNFTNSEYAFQLSSTQPYDIPKFNFDNIREDYHNQIRTGYFPWWNVKSPISIYNKLWEQIFSSDRDIFFQGLFDSSIRFENDTDVSPETTRTNPLVIDTKNKNIQYLSNIPCIGAYINATINLNYFYTWNNEMGRPNNYWVNDKQVYTPLNKYTKVRFTADFYNDSYLNLYISGHWCGNAVNDFLLNLPDVTKPEFNSNMNPEITLGYMNGEFLQYTNVAVSDDAINVATERGWTIYNNLEVGEFD